MPSQETGKSRAQRIQLDYHKQPDPLNRLRWLCVLVAIVAVGAYVAYAMLPVGATQISPGPLAMAHASFENDCSKCHSGWRLLTKESDDWEDKCQECHQTDHHFPSRLTDEKKAVERNCKNCHREHQGHNHDLVHLAGKACQQCHGQLERVVSPQRPTVRADIEQFSLESHGEFRSLKADSGEIRFDHDLHLQKGQVANGDKGGMTLGTLPEWWRNVYRKEGQVDDDLITLKCQDCHEPNSPPPSQHNNAADADLGRYYAPIGFDRHCAACHSLNYSVQTDELLPLPHAVPWRELETILTSKLVGGRMTGRIRAPSDAAPRQPYPGTGTTPTTGADFSKDEVTRMLFRVKNRCRQCHREEDLSVEAIDRARASRTNALIPSRWLLYGYFAHDAHAGLDCQFCHDVVSVDAANQPDHQPDHQRVMIRNIESCTPCHRPAEADAPQILDEDPYLSAFPTTWASDHCTLCHRYHWTRPTSATDGGAQP